MFPTYFCIFLKMLETELGNYVSKLSIYEGVERGKLLIFNFHFIVLSWSRVLQP